MKITRRFPPPPPQEYVMTFSKYEGWVLVAALREYTDRHINAISAASRDKWYGWASHLDRELRA